MKTLHLYLTRHVLASLVMTVAVFTFILLVGNVLKEVLALLVNRQATFGAVAQAVALLIPYVLVYALPMGLLTSTLLVFGRFSADHELTAVRAGGVSLIALITPVLLVSVALSGLCALINTQWAPECHVAYQKVLYRIGVRSPVALLTEKTFIRDFKGYIVYASKVDGQELKDVLIYNLTGDRIDSYIRAASGTVRMDAAGHKLKVQLRDAWRLGVTEGKRVAGYMGEWELPDVEVAPPPEQPVGLIDMTFLQLRDELRDLEQRLGGAIPFTKGATNAPPLAAHVLEEHRRDLTTPVKVQIHRQVSFSFACLGFTLIGIPLGIRAHRRETTFGIAVAIVLVLIYHSFFVLGQALETRPEYAPHLLLWLPNFLFQAVGIVLLWRANRGV
jgi:lipopolysaccharide export system permease protein